MEDGRRRVNGVIGPLLSGASKARAADFLAFCLLSAVFTLIWLRNGRLVAGGETGLQLYDSNTWLRLTQHIWWGDFATGAPMPHNVASLPFHFLMALLQNLGVSPVVRQGLFFFAALLLGGYFQYALTLKLTAGGGNRFSAMVSGLFYVVNPYAMYSVWHRFLYHMMMLYAILPLIMLLFITGVEQGRNKNALWLSIVMTLSSIAFIVLPFAVTTWGLLLSFLVFYIVTNIRDRPRTFRAMQFFVLSLTIWVLTNAWWIAGDVVLGPDVVFQRLSYDFAKVSLATLQGASVYTTLPFILRLFPSTIYTDPSWGQIYSSPLFELISFIPVLLVFGMLPFIIRRRYVQYFLALLLAALFFTKGSAPPFGEVYSWLFASSPFFAMFRSPFEKIGIVLPIAYSFLLGSATGRLFEGLVDRSSTKSPVLSSEPGTSIGPTVGGRRRIACASFLVAILMVPTFIVYPWPMWTGQVFYNPYCSVHVDVPPYYSEVKTWLSKQDADYRTLVMPFQGDGVILRWEYGYAGADPSLVLFDRPTISRSSSIRDVDAILDRLGLFLRRSNRVWKLMSLLNVKNIVVRGDVDTSFYTDVDTPLLTARLLTRGTVPDKSTSFSIANFTDRESWSGSIDGQVEVALEDEDVTVRFLNSSGPQYNLIYNMRSAMDWTYEKYVEFWLKTENPGGPGEIPIRVMVNTVDDGWSHLWKYSLYAETPERWAWYAIPLEWFRPEAASSWSIVKGVGFQIPAQSGSVSIRDVRIDSGVEKNQENIDPDRVLGALKLFTVSESVLAGHFYAANGYEIADDFYDMLFNVIDTDSFDPRTTVVFLSTQAEVNEINDLAFSMSSGLPTVRFRRVSPTRYDVWVSNATAPFVLVFSETYDRRWSATVNGNQVGKHLMLNGYANGWYIHKDGSYAIDLEYLPQRLVSVGLAISLSTLIGLAAYVIVDWRRRCMRSATNIVRD